MYELYPLQTRGGKAREMQSENITGNDMLKSILVEFRVILLRNKNYKYKIIK